MNNFSEIKTLVGHTGWVNSVNFNHEGKILASGSSDGLLKLWDLEQLIEIQSININSNELFYIKFSTDS